VLSRGGALLVFLGVILVFAGILAGKGVETGSSAGIVILIGPIPIIIGSGPGSALLLVLALVLTIAAAIWFLVNALAGARVPK
jgi:uncharacterized membrane protein